MAAVARLSEEFMAMSGQLARVAGRLVELERALAVLPGPYPQAVAVPPPVSVAAAPPFLPPPPPPLPPTAPPYPTAPPPLPVALPYPTEPPPPRTTLADRFGGDAGQGWIGKLLAVAGVAVTLIGVVLLLVLAAQAGILRPEIRVDAGAALAAALVAIGVRLNRRPGGRVGATALAATGIAAAYMDVVAITTIYGWVPQVVGLLIASAIGAAGLTLARRWDSQQLGLLVLVPLIVLAPIVVGGITLLLIGFMIMLSAVTLPVQLGKDWIWMHAARTAAVSVPLPLALLIATFPSSPSASSDNPWLLGGATAVAALLAVVSALVLLPGTSKPVAIASLTVTGVLPALLAGIAVGRLLAALIAAAVSVGMLVIVVMGERLPGVRGAVVPIWSALSAVAAVVAVTVAFDGQIAGPVLLGLAFVVAVAGRHERVARWAAIVFAAVGGLFYLAFAPPERLVHAKPLTASVAVSTLAASVLGVACALAIAWSWTRARGDHTLDGSAWLIWGTAGAVTAYGVTMFTVTTGVVIGGPDGGFLAGHMAATICWIAMAAGLFVAALRMRDRDVRTAPIAGGLALTAAAMAKLFLFDLGTLDGMFRVAAFIVVGLVLLGMGAGYARSLAQQDRDASDAPAGKSVA
jgi:uncharacterized membrane protein